MLTSSFSINIHSAMVRCLLFMGLQLTRCENESAFSVEGLWCCEPRHKTIWHPVISVFTVQFVKTPYEVYTRPPHSDDHSVTVCVYTGMCEECVCVCVERNMVSVRVPACHMVGLWGYQCVTWCVCEGTSLSHGVCDGTSLGVETPPDPKLCTSSST